MASPDHSFREGFAAFYGEHSNRVLVFFARRTYDAEAAFDLTAETFAQALASKSRFRDGSSEAAEKWLFGIARNVLRRYFRKGRLERRALDRLGIEVPTLTDPEIERIETLAELVSLRAAVREGLDRLSAEQRDALDLRVVCELSYPEVAARLGISEQSARARVSRGLRKLASHLDGPTIEEGRA